MQKILFALVSALIGSVAYGQGLVSSFLATDPATGSMQILQVTGADAGPTTGGPAVADTRTVFFWTPDLAKVPPVSPGYVGANWPYVFVNAGFSAHNSLNGAMFGTITVAGSGGNLSGEVLTVNGYPVYQRTSHTAPGQIAGIGPNWPVVGTDGLPYTQIIPEPGPVSLAVLGLGALWLARRTQRRA